MLNQTPSVTPAAKINGPRRPAASLPHPRSDQIPIDSARGSPHTQLPAGSFPGGFRTTAPGPVASSVMGRHPKPFTFSTETSPAVGPAMSAVPPEPEVKSGHWHVPRLAFLRIDGVARRVIQASAAHGAIRIPQSIRTGRPVRRSCTTARATAEVRVGQDRWP
jgi:hypothetical protein